MYLETVANGGRHIGFSSFNLSHFDIFPLGVYETIEPADGIIGFAILVEISIGKTGHRLAVDVQIQHISATVAPNPENLLLSSMNSPFHWPEKFWPEVPVAIVDNK